MGCSIHENQDKSWKTYSGSTTSNNYSSLSQINVNNVDQLQKAWIFHTKDSGAAIECNPIIIDEIMYVTSPALKVMALNAATGKLIWKFNPFKKSKATGVNRGVTYWENGADKRIYFTAGHNLYALNAKSGSLVTSFGNNGIVDLRRGLNRNLYKIYVHASSPGIIYKNYFILGTHVTEDAGAAPGYVRAYDVQSGKIVWTFHTIPQPGNTGYKTWDQPDAWMKTGGANDWGGLSLDKKRGWVFLATGSATPDFYGANRKGKDLFANSVIALKAKSGKMVWYYQTVHHDLWDYDLPCAPNLIKVKHNGKKIDAVAQVTKSGNVFVLDRETGKPLFPVKERKVPSSHIPGEAVWPTQRFPVKPPAFSRQEYTKEDLPTISPEAKNYAIKKLKDVRNKGIFTPPSVDGTVEIPGTRGGAEWSGASFDIKTGILYVNANDIPNIQKLKKIKMSSNLKENVFASGENLFQVHCASCHGVERKGQGPYPSLVGIANKLKRSDALHLINTGRGQMPSFSSRLTKKQKNAIIDYLFNASNKKNKINPNRKAEKSRDSPFTYVNTGYNQFRDNQGYPAIKPPWGTLNAINLNTGKIIWKVPLGAFDKLSKQGMPPTGTQNLGGTLVTAGGLVFVGATKDEKFRAFDKKTGKLLWQTLLPAGGYATPSTYKIDGKQYVVIAAGGGGKNGTKKSDAYVSFSLP